MAKLKQSASTKAYFASSQAMNTVGKNRAKRLARHLKNHPNDVQTANAAKNGRGHKRAKPASANSTIAKSPYFDGAGNRVAGPSFSPAFVKARV